MATSKKSAAKKAGKKVAKKKATKKSAAKGTPKKKAAAKQPEKKTRQDLNKRDTRTHRQKNRAIRQEELREMLANRCRLQHILENIEKLEDLGVKMKADAVNRVKVANEQRLKLLNKYLPDLRSVEVTGEDGGPLQHKFVAPDQYDEEAWAQKHKS